MDAAEVLKKFLTQGLQLDLESLNFFTTSPDKINIFLETIGKEAVRPSTITKKEIQKLLPESDAKIKIVEMFPTIHETLTVEEMTEMFQKQYEQIKKLLSNRVDLPNTISINKISDRIKQFSVVATVLEIDGRILTLEDSTGKISTRLAAEVEQEAGLLILDETAGFVCEKTEDDIIIKKIIQPDITFKKEIKKTTEDTLVLFSPSEKIQEINAQIKFFFQQNEIKVIMNSSVQILPDPCIIDISDVKIFLSSGKDLENFKNKLGVSSARVLLNLVKKRLLHPSKPFIRDTFFEEIPDIFVVNFFGEAEDIKYKGTEFLSLGSEDSSRVGWIVNLRTRENVKISLDK